MKVAYTRTTQSVVVTGGSAAGGMFSADQVTGLLAAYWPMQPWDLWEPFFAVGIATFGGVLVDAVFRIIGTAVAVLPDVHEDGDV